MVIVDSSVAIKWYFDEEGSEEARRLLSREEVGTPDLLLYEFSNYLAHKTFLTSEEATAFLDKLYSLSLQFFLLPQKGFRRAIQLAKEFHISSYDACFLALAESLKTRFITADRRLVQKAKALPFVRLLDL